MRRLSQRLSQLQRLTVFEAAARIGTFTGAAHELGLTQPSVTRQIRALEREIGASLFDRTPNTAALSPSGAELFESVEQAFALLEAAIDRLDNQSSFVLAANPGVAQRWLVAHLDSLEAALPGREIRLWLFDRNADFGRGGFDAAVHVGHGDWVGHRATHLFDEAVVPVASPEFALAHQLDEHSDANQLSGVPLLHLDTEDRSWASWSDWFGAHSLESPAARVVFSNWTLALDEAIAGRGVALGWRGLIEHHIERGLLVEVGSLYRPPNSAYFAIWPHGIDSETRHTVNRWLLELVHSTDDDPTR